MGHDALHGNRKRLVVELRQQIRRWEGGGLRTTSAGRTTGSPELDTLLPGGGVRAGTMVEWIGGNETGGAETVSLVAGCTACPADWPLLLIDPTRHVSPLALSALGVDLGRLLIVRPNSDRETLWACEEALHCPGVGLVWARVNRLPTAAFRRLRLAVEASQGVGFLVRPEQALRDPSWAEVRLRVQPRPALEAAPRFRVEVIYSQGGPVGSAMDLRIDAQRGTIHADTQHSHADSVPVASWLANPAT